MLTANITKRLDVPGEEGEHIVIRKLPWRKLRDAQEAHRSASYAHVKLLGKEGMDAVRDVTPEQIDALRKDPKQQYDWGTLLRAGVTEWSYSAKPTPQEIDDQDPAWAEWAVTEILTLAGVIPDEAAAKNA